MPDNRTTRETEQQRLAEWRDARVRLVYELLCNGETPPAEEHWEGFIARRIVAELDRFPVATSTPKAPQLAATGLITQR